MPFPIWFHLLAIAIVVAGILSAVGVAIDVIRNPQHMGIMNVVWPVTALFGTLAIVFAYLRFGRRASERAVSESGTNEKPTTPFAAMVGKGALHCGSGCMIGDLLAEWLAFLVPGIALALGWRTVFSQKMFAVWILDFVFAFLFGVVFQYFSIVPMRKLSPLEGIKASLKADTFSLIAWQVGMYAAMGVLQLLVFPSAFGRQAEVDSFEFWFAMQIAMVCGFLTSYPVNWWLIKKGIKEKM